MESGLPQNTVQSLLASKTGYLWLGTELGLVRFNGYSFVTLSPATRPAFAPSDVRGIYEESPTAFEEFKKRHESDVPWPHASP